MTINYRLFELQRIVSEINPGSSILEIGGGSGWQARKLSEMGFNVTSIDIPYIAARSYPIIEYDGKQIPFPDRSFDVIFSSNVLEHISHLDSFESEILRVLKETGKVIHLLPTATWRFWTICAHYPYYTIGSITRLMSIFVKRTTLTNFNKQSCETIQSKKSFFEHFTMALYPHRHGEKGTCLTEIYYFSRIRWTRHFKDHGWIIENHYFNNLFYTLHPLLGRTPQLQLRTALSHLFGSSCHIYILRKKPAQ
jgi:ubiquinone/menaquinone biosynthesis C-methylase UbiE